MKDSMNKDDFSDPEGSTRYNKFNILKIFFGKKKSLPNITEKLQEIVSSRGSTTEKIGDEEKEILINAIKFTDTKVEEVMVPRTDIAAVELTTNFSKIKKMLIEKGHTRIPVYSESLDNIKGFIHIKDLICFFSDAKNFKISKILRKALFVPPSMDVADLVLKMRNTRIRLAIVIDEYGGTDGMITMEDLMEEIVGENDEEDIKQIEDNVFEVNARIRIEDIEEKLNIKLVNTKDIDNDFDTLAGLIVKLSKKIPKNNEVIKFSDNIKFIIKEAEERFVKKVIIKISDK
jgi:magnesium and cobalt transporter